MGYECSYDCSTLSRVCFTFIKKRIVSLELILDESKLNKKKVIYLLKKTKEFVIT